MAGSPLHYLFLAVVGVVAIAVTAFMAGRSFEGGCFFEHSQSTPHVSMADPRFAARFASSLAASDAGNGSDSSNNTVLRYANMSEHPACAFYRSGAGNVHNEHGWGPWDQCDMNKPQDWLKRARSNCYSCISGANVCTNPPRMQYHQYLESLHPEVYEGNLLSMRAFLMTQNLARAHMYVWVPNITLVVVPNKTAEFFETYKEYITVKVFDYNDVIQGTPFEGHDYFGNASMVKSHMPHAGSFSDIVRILILHKYGGFWMDNDVVLYQDLTHLLSTSYQFVMRWMNLHIMRMEKGSRLMQRALQVATTLPLNHPDFKATVIDTMCRPHGYYQLVPADYGYTDIYNGCLFRLLLRFNNTGPPDAVLYDMPLGWFDHDWKGCFNSRKNLSDTKWREVATHFLAMHNRYPKDLKLGDEPNIQDTPLSRVLRTTAAFFKACNRTDCLPIDGMSIMAYDGFDEGPPKQQRRRLQQLLQQSRQTHWQQQIQQLQQRQHQLGQ